MILDALMYAHDHGDNFSARRRKHKETMPT